MKQEITAHALNATFEISQDQTRANSSSSSSIYNKTTTRDEVILPVDWQAVDITPLANINFTVHHLAQIAKQNLLNPETVQESINAFAFDLEVTRSK